MEHRLAAILAADMVGYSRLMAVDESETIERQKEIRGALIDPKVDGFGGRIVKTTGDGLLLEFSSVLDAVQCAVEVQICRTSSPSGGPRTSQPGRRVCGGQGWPPEAARE